MLSKEKNSFLTQVGPGTPMGNLLRRYWIPAALSTELDSDGTPARVKILGEELVAFRDSRGELGLVEEQCPHRGASLFYGRNEECGLRCAYHGWKYDVTGQCVDMPNEQRSFADIIQAKTYPTHESGGIVWTYMGDPSTMTPFRDFGTESLPAAEVAVHRTYRASNWIQAMEGNLDTAHISFLHQFNGIEEIPDDGSDRPGYPSNAMSWRIWRHDGKPRIEIEDTWFGFRYVGLRTTPKGNTHARVTAYVLPFTTLVPKIPLETRNALFIPIDDESCWHYNFAAKSPGRLKDVGGPDFFSFVPYSFVRKNGGGHGTVERPYTADNDYGIDRNRQRDVSFSGIDDFSSQDMMVTESMKPVVDRSKEHLGSTDRAVIKMRSMLLNAARAVAEGEDPPALLVDDEHDYRKIWATEKILDVGEDWHELGTVNDPIVEDVVPIVDIKVPTI